MSRSFKKAIFLLSSATIIPATAAVEAPFEVGTWGNFCKGAISHTFDDNTPNQTGTGQTAFDEKGFRMTLFTTTGSGVSSSANWANLKKAFSKGHEIASHSHNHPNPGTMSVDDLSESQQIIRQNVSGERCVTIAYPNCNTPGDQQVLQHYIAGRNCYNEGKNGKSPTNWAQINAKMFGSCNGCLNAAEPMNNFADQAASSNGWYVSCHHGIGNEQHGHAVTNLNEMKKHLDYLDKNRDKIWVETFGNVARYIKERDAASLAVKSSTDNTITITLTDNLPDSIYNYPLSIRRELPTGWTTAFVTQAGEEVEDTIVTINSKTYVMFKAVPDAGDIVINKDITVVKNRTVSSAARNTVTLNNSRLTIDAVSFSGSAITVSLFDLKGKLIARHSFNKSLSYVEAPAGILANSTFVVKISDGNNSTIHKMIRVGQN